MKEEKDTKVKQKENEAKQKKKGKKKERIQVYNILFICLVRFGIGLGKLVRLFRAVHGNVKN